MDLKNVINNQENILDFISSNFFDFTISNKELLQANHSMFSYKFNKALLWPRKEYTLFGLPVNDQYAYRLDNDNFCLYLLLDIDKDKLDVIVKQLGFPANITEEDYETDDFDFLAWHLADMDITIQKDRMGMLRSPGATKINMCITNMKYKDILSTERIF